MNILDPYIFYILIFLPLAAAAFIMLIPAVDTGSKLTISKFFSICGFFAFLRVFILFLDHKIATDTTLSFSLATFNINIILHLTEYNIFLYCAGSAALMVYLLSYEINDTKTNIHQVTPFILTFLLYISFGQTDLRIALPILSIANFLVYFLIGFTDKTRRGSTIFQMGIFLFSCDAAALVLLQIPYNNDQPILALIINMIFLVPGLARLCMPMFAPFMRKLLLNVDESEGPFLISFLQLSGFFILIMTKTGLVELTQSLTIIIACLMTIGAIHVALLAFIDHKIKTLPYYFLIFYSSLSVVILFISVERDTWFFSISLTLTSLACLFQTARFNNLFNQYQIQELNLTTLRSSWFIALAMMLGLPGLGIGTSLWTVIYRFMGLFESENLLEPFWSVVAICYLVGILILSYALIMSARKLELVPKVAILLDSRLLLKRSLLFGPVLIAIISWLIPLATFYAAAGFR